MLGEGYGSPGNVHKVHKMLTKCSRGQKNRTKRDANDNTAMHYNEYNTDRCCKESASKQESTNKQYGVITNTMQIGLITKFHIRNKKASKRAASSEKRAARTEALIKAR